MPFCNRCGSKYSFGEKKCQNCGTNLPRISAKSSEQASLEKFRSPTLQRIISGFIDIFIAFSLFFIFFFYKKVLILGLFKKGIAIVIPHLYLLFKDSIEGKSIGKTLLGIMVYNSKEFKAAGVFDSIIRNWYLAIPILGPTVILCIIGIQILTGHEKRLGDYGAHTIVITDSDYQRIK